MFKSILLATDGSAASEHAAKLAVSMARLNGAVLTALYVSDPYPYLGVGEVNPMGYQAYSSAAQQLAAQAHAQVEALCNAESPAVNLTVRLVEDVAAASGCGASVRFSSQRSLSTPFSTSVPPKTKNEPPPAAAAAAALAAALAEW